MKKFRDFESAREFARLLNLKNFTEWQEYCKSGNKPDDIPSNPNATYKNDGYIDLGDWLGTGTVSSQKRVYRDFKKEFARLQDQRIKAFAEFHEDTIKKTFNDPKITVNIEDNEYHKFLELSEKL